MQTISISIICQNEDKHITECLDWLTEYVNPDEIVIVDGGSVDNTLWIISTYIRNGANIKLIQNTMPDIFSQQRNLALGNCTKDWILSIDIDETYSKNISSLISDIRNDKYNNINGFIFPTAHLIKDQLHMVNGGGDIHIRLFRNLPEIKYVGDVHENLYLGELSMIHNQVECKIIRMASVALKHHSLLKSDEELLIKGKRYMRWAQKSTMLGIAIDNEYWFINSKNDYLGKKMYDVPKEWQ